MSPRNYRACYSIVYPSPLLNCPPGLYQCLPLSNQLSPPWVFCSFNYDLLEVVEVLQRGDRGCITMGFRGHSPSENVLNLKPWNAISCTLSNTFIPYIYTALVLCEKNLKMLRYMVTRMVIEYFLAYSKTQIWNTRVFFKVEPTLTVDLLLFTPLFLSKK
jgi:hypothetical protein